MPVRFMSLTVATCLHSRPRIRARMVGNLIVGGGSISGTVDTGSCGVYNISGSHVGLSFSADAAGGPAGCCNFRYDGVADKLSRTASRTWVQPGGAAGCTGSGKFIMGLC